MVNYSDKKLGKQAPHHDRRALQLANYLQLEVLPPPPERKDWSPAVRKWPMMKNDVIGDCTCAAAGHLIQDWTANAGQEQIIPDAAVVAAYAEVSGYDPNTGKNDLGAVEADVLNYWRKTGIGGHTIGAYAALEPKNTDHVKNAAFLFGGCYIGLALPKTAQTQTTWSVPPGGPVGRGAPNSWGGHAVPVVAYSPQGLTVVTWGALQSMTWEFWTAYCDEAYAVLSVDFIKPDGKAPSGFDLNTLRKDLSLVTQ